MKCKYWSKEMNVFHTCAYLKVLKKQTLQGCCLFFSGKDPALRLYHWAREAPTLKLLVLWAVTSRTYQKRPFPYFLELLLKWKREFPISNLWFKKHGELISLKKWSARNRTCSFYWDMDFLCKLSKRPCFS